MVDLIKKIIETIEPSIGIFKEKFYPASAILKNGNVLDCVYFVHKKNGTSGKIDIKDIEDIKESSYRLPARFANEIYQHGETGMGWIGFNIEMRDYRGFCYFNTGAIDFIDLPDGYEMNDIIGVNGMHDYALLDEKDRKVKDSFCCLIDDNSLS